MKTIKYYAYKDNEEMALRNGSTAKHGGFAQYMNGDFMGFVQTVDHDKFSEVETARAFKLIPKCCGGKGGAI